MTLSIVTTLYSSAQYIEEFYNRIKKTADKITKDYEIIFVNDGSPDNSLDIAVSLHEKDKKVKVIDLSRNFGHHKAMMTGLSHTKGNFVFLIDCDLEEKPELLEKFYDEFKNRDNVDVVYGVQEKRRGGIFEKISGGIFYQLFNLLSDVKITPNLLTIRLMNRNYVDNLTKHLEDKLFMAGIFEITGFNQVPIIVEKKSRDQTSYSIRRRISLLVNAITSFSDKPLKLIFYLGFLMIFFSGCYSIYLIAKKLIYQIAIGWASVMVSIWLLSGVIIFSLGVIGIYLSRIFIETKNRPFTIIKKIYE